MCRPAKCTGEKLQLLLTSWAGKKKQQLASPSQAECPDAGVAQSNTVGLSARLRRGGLDRADRRGGAESDASDSSFVTNELLRGDPRTVQRQPAWLAPALTLRSCVYVLTVTEVWNMEQSNGVNLSTRRVYCIYRLLLLCISLIVLMRIEWTLPWSIIWGYRNIWQCCGEKKIVINS